VVVRAIEENKKITIGKHKCVQNYTGSHYDKRIAGVRLNRTTLISQILQRKIYRWQGIQISTVAMQIDL
jgi:hypothetical protein